MTNDNFNSNQGFGSVSNNMAYYPNTQSLGSSQDHGTCPSCGYCKHCGRSRNGQNFYPYQYPYTYSQSHLTNTQNVQALGDLLQKQQGQQSGTSQKDPNEALLRQSFQKS